MRLLSAKSVRHAQVISIVGGLFSLSMAVPPVLLGIVGVSTSKFWAVIKDLVSTNKDSIITFSIIQFVTLVHLHSLSDLLMAKSLSQIRYTFISRKLHVRKNVKVQYSRSCFHNWMNNIYILRLDCHRLWWRPNSSRWHSKPNATCYQLSYTPSHCRDRYEEDSASPEAETHFCTSLFVKKGTRFS